MAGTNKIFKDLQDFSVDPPRGMFAKLWKKILDSGTKHFELTDPALNVSNDQPANDDITSYGKIFSDLKSYTDKESTPPPFDYAKITAALSDTRQITTSKKAQQKNKLVPLFYKIAAAAVFTGIAFYIYYNNSTKDQSSSTENTLIVPVAKNAENDLIIPRDTGYHIENSQKDQVENKAVVNHPIQKSIFYENNFLTQHVKTRDLYNDFFYVLTNFRYEQVKPFLADIKKDKKISLNNYSYLNISDKMAAFLKKMYAVNRDEKPTRKAKKLKSKLAKWKKKDEANFDRNLQKNPLDILDLSEFIFKK